MKTTIETHASCKEQEVTVSKQAGLERYTITAGGKTAIEIGWAKAMAKLERIGCSKQTVLDMKSDLGQYYIE